MLKTTASRVAARLFIVIRRLSLSSASYAGVHSLYLLMSSFSGDYYRRLRLPKNASRQDIKAAFRRLSRQHHPDRHPNRHNAAVVFQSLREAYEVLIDRVQRQHYDQICHSAGQNEALIAAAFSRDNHQLLNPQTPTDFYLRGVRYAIAQNYKAALQEYDCALALNSKLEAAYLRRAEARYSLGDDPGVLADCQRAIALDPHDSQTHYYLGLARFRLGYVQSAIAAFTNAIAQDPEDAQSFARRGLAHEDLNDRLEAAQDLRRAAQLYRQQGDITKYQRLQQYLRRFGTMGRSLPVKTTQWIAQTCLNFWTGLWAKLSKGLGLKQPNTGQNWLTAEAAEQDAIIRQRSVDQFSLRPENNRPKATPPKNNHPETNQPDSIPLPPLKPTHKHPDRKRRWPLVERRWPSLSHGESRQIYWAPGVSSRPLESDPPPSDRPFRRFLGGVHTTFRLLTNPAGELVPVYRQLSYSQANRVGYGLAVLANLCLMTGLMSLLNQTTWLEASRLWAAGGTAYVSMVLAIAIARLCLRIRGLWAADIFTVGTAVLPLGLCACMIVGIKAAMVAIAKALAIAPPPPALWFTNLLILSALFWAISHSLIALYNGLCQLHPFPAKVAAWFVPLVIAIGFATGLGSWEWLAAPASSLIFR